MSIEYQSVISKQKAKGLLEKFNFQVDNDSNLDRDIEEYYFVENLGYLIIFDILNEAILYKSKDDYLAVMKRDSSEFYTNLDLEEVVNNKALYIRDLAESLDLNLTIYDEVKDLKILDKKIKVVSPEILQQCFSGFIAYFFTVIYNELESESWEYQNNKNGYLELIIIGKNGIKYSGFYGKIWEIIFEGSKEYTLESISDIVLNPISFKLKMGGRETDPK